jgi:hypothetical protein
MRSAGKITLICLSSLFLIFTGMAGTAQAKSLYEIASAILLTLGAALLGLFKPRRGHRFF